MSDLMFYGVLRTPYEMAMSDALSQRQFYDRAQQAVDRVEAADKRIAEQLVELDHAEQRIVELEEAAAAVAPAQPAPPVDAAGERVAFEAWAKTEGLIQESFGIRSESSMCGTAMKAWQAGRAALAAQRQADALAVIDTGLPELREHLYGAAIAGNPVTLSHQAAWALFHAMSTGEPATVQQVGAALDRPAGAGQTDCYCGGWDDATGRYHQGGCPEADAPQPSGPIAPVVAEYALRALQNIIPFRVSLLEKKYGADVNTKVILDVCEIAAADISAQPSAQPAPADCDTCHGTGMQHAGYSDQDSDGNAPLSEPCGECGYGMAPAVEPGQAGSAP